MFFETRLVGRGERLVLGVVSVGVGDREILGPAPEAGYARRMAPDELHYTDPSAPRHHEHHLRTPTGELSHAEKLRRQQLHMRILCAVIVVLLALCAYAAAFDLNSWAEWAVFGGICAVAIGAIVALSPRRES